MLTDAFQLRTFGMGPVLLVHARKSGAPAVDVLAKVLELWLVSALLGLVHAPAESRA